MRPLKPSVGCSGYGIVETAIVVIVVAALVAIAVNHYSRSIGKTRDTAIRAELSTLRNTVSIFSAMNKRCPKSLKELLDTEFAIPYKTGPTDVTIDETGTMQVEDKILFDPEYLKSYALDEEGNILDPFGNPYAYDPLTCSVHSLEPGYENL